MTKLKWTPALYPPTILERKKADISHFEFYNTSKGERGGWLKRDVNQPASESASALLNSKQSWTFHNASAPSVLVYTKKKRTGAKKKINSRALQIDKLRRFASQVMSPGQCSTWINDVRNWHNVTTQSIMRPFQSRNARIVEIEP